MRDRSKTIGASEIAGLFGESPYTSEYKLFCEKTGLIPREEWDGPTSERMQIGKDLERPVLEIWAKRTGLVADHNVYSFACRSVDGLSATPDATIGRSPRSPIARAVVDVKTVRPNERKAWSETGVPRHYWWQLQAQMMCLEVPTAYLVALFSVDEIAHQEIAADPAAFERIKDAVNVFWARCRGELPPPPVDDHKATLVAVLAQSRDAEKVIELPPYVREAGEELARTRASMKQLAKIERELKAGIIASLGDASCGLFADGSGFRMRIEERKESIVKAHKRQALVPFKGKDAEEGDEDE